MSSVSVPALPVSTPVSDSPSLKRGRSASLKLTDTASGFWLPECLMAPSTAVPFTETSSSSTGDHGVDAWISSLVAGRARTSPTLGDEKASEKETAAACGSKSSASFGRFDPGTSLVRTCQLSLDGEWIPFSETFPTSGLMQSGRLYRRPTWARPTSASGYSCWPTPNTPNGGRKLSEADTLAKGRTAKGKRQVGLENVATLWPTAGANDWKGTAKPGQRRGQLDEAAEQKWPTPKSSAENYGQPRENDRGDLQAAGSLWATPRTAMCSMYAESDETLKARGRDGRDTLPRQANLWATPNERDYKGAPGSGCRERGGRQVSLPAQIMSFPPVPPTEPAGGATSPGSPRLSPAFVEALCGLPIGWTVCGP